MNNDSNGGKERPFTRMDLSKIKDGESFFDGSLYDANDKFIGPIPMKEYASDAEWKKDLEDMADDFKPIRWNELNDMQFPDERWWVKDLIPKGGSVILASISGEGKTWIALELARNIAMGMNFVSEERFATIQGKVLYIDAENPKSELQRRGRQLGFIDNDNLLIWPIDDINLFKEETADELIANISKHKFDVVFIDTFRAVAGGLQEEKAEQVRTFFGRFKTLKERDVCIVWLDHFRKPNHFEGKIPKKEHLFGSQDKAACIEVLLMMKKEDNRISIYQRKNRLGKEINPFNIEMSDYEDVDGKDRTSIEYIGEIDEKESKKEEAMEFILTLLGEGAKTTPDIVEIVYRERKIAERNVREALKALFDTKLVDKRRNGRRDEYFLISAGGGDGSDELATLFVAS